MNTIKKGLGLTKEHVTILNKLTAREEVPVISRDLVRFTITKARNRYGLNIYEIREKGKLKESLILTSDHILDWVKDLRIYTEFLF